MKFSAIIPAYNEWPRITNIIKILLQCEKLSEIIIVDDGSTDNTKSEIEHFSHEKIKKIFKEKNAGKARAVMDGIFASSGDYIVMIDSDLIGLEPYHINELISPVEEKIADTTLSIRRDSMTICRFFGSDFLSGDRVIPREIFTGNPDYFTNGKGYGLEVKLNKKILEKKFLIKNVDFKNVSAPSKREKYGFFQGIKKDIKMFYEVLKTVSIFEFLRQFWLFSRFSSRTK